MDLGDEKSEDNAKYSFLLGAALRNDDPDQFLNIYDDILPKDIRPEEVERVKGTARRIASLPEDQFNELVAQARDFSLVFSPRASTMTDPSEALRSAHISMTSSISSSAPSEIKYMELEEMKKPDQVDCAHVDDDCDSGVCNSSKNTCSLSDDNDLTDDSERAGVINYFYTSSVEKPLKSASATSAGKLHIAQQHSDAYDDSFEADSPLESSPNELHSPKSEEDSDFLEARSKFMECHSNARAHRQRDDLECPYSWQLREQNAALQKKNNMMYDEVEPVHSDDELTEIKIDSQKDETTCPDEVDIDSVNIGPRFTSPDLDFENGMARGSKAHHLQGSLHFNTYRISQTAPEKPVQFPLRYTRVSNAATHTTPSSSFSASRMPPLQSGAVRSSVGSNATARSAEQAECLIDFSRSKPAKDSSAQIVSLFDPPGNSSDEAQMDKKKKKKTKKTQKEEGNKDINGNPVREESPPASTSSSSSTSSSCAVDRTRRDCPPCFTLSSFPGSLNQFSSDLTSKVSATSSHDMTTSDNKAAATARKKKKKAKEDQQIKAEEIPGHKGNLDVSDLLKYITGNPYNNKENDKTGNSKNRKKKKVPTATLR